MSSIGLRVFESGVNCEACILLLIGNPDAFNEITDEPEHCRRRWEQFG